MSTLPWPCRVLQKSRADFADHVGGRRQTSFDPEEANTFNIAGGARVGTSLNTNQTKQILIGNDNFLFSFLTLSLYGGRRGGGMVRLVKETSATFCFSCVIPYVPSWCVEKILEKLCRLKFNYSPFHKTLPKSSLQMHWTAVSFLWNGRYIKMVEREHGIYVSMKETAGSIL